MSRLSINAYEKSEDDSESHSFFTTFLRNFKKKKKKSNFYSQQNDMSPPSLSSQHNSLTHFFLLAFIECPTFVCEYLEKLNRKRNFKPHEKLPFLKVLDISLVIIDFKC